MFSFNNFRIFHIFLALILIYEIQTTKPKISEFAKSQVRPESSKLKIHCSLFDGTKPVRFQWKHNDHIILNSASRIVIENSEDDSVLKITDLKASDSGNYSCSAENSFGIDIQTSVLMVKG